MTKQRDFKARVRERMQRTGERYSAARAQLLKQHTPTSSGTTYPGLLSGYTHFGGIQGDTGALRNVLEHAGVRATHTGEPYDEAMLSGLCGGVGFGYFVFEYKGWPPMLTITARASTMPDSFVLSGLEHIGVRIQRHETTGSKTARKALESVVSDGRAAICLADSACLPHHGLPEEWAGMGPEIVGIAGMHEDHAWLDDRSVEPVPIEMAQLSRARAAYKKGKHLLITVEPPSTSVNIAKAIKKAIRLTTKAYREAPYKNFASNFGFAGMKKWQRLLTDPKDPKGWQRLFADGNALYTGVRRAYDCIEHEYTPPAAGRGFYAEFLVAAADILSTADLRQAAELYLASGKRWSEVSALLATGVHPSIQRGCDLSDQRAELLDSGGKDRAGPLAALWKERSELGGDCSVSGSTLTQVCEEIAERVGDIHALETEAVEAMERCLG